MVPIRGEVVMVRANRKVQCAQCIDCSPTLTGEDADCISEALATSLDTEALQQVLYIATDSPSSKLFFTLKKCLVNLRALSLDPVHLAIVYEYAHWHRRTSGSKVLRQLLNKVNIVDQRCSHKSWGSMFCGSHASPLTAQEERLRHMILNSSMPERAAKIVLARLDPATPLFCRITFIETVAAIAQQYESEVCRKVTGQNKEVRQILWAACAPDRLGWLMNNLMVRHGMEPWQRALLPSGTSSNEALHAQINTWTRPIRTMHRSTLRLKQQIMQFGKLLAHQTALFFPTSRQMPEGSLLAQCVGVDVWCEEQWRCWCRINKAKLPLHSARRDEVQAVKDWRSATTCKPKTVRKRAKRTVFTLARRHRLRRGGVK